MSQNKKFNNLDEAIKYILDDLSADEKDALKNADPMGAHFALDRWVKSEYLSNKDLELSELVSNFVRDSDPNYEDSPDRETQIHLDDVAGIIIDQLLAKLKS